MLLLRSSVFANGARSMTSFTGRREPALVLPMCARGLAVPSRGPLGKDRETTYQFVDKVQIEVKGGNGGDGCVSFEGVGPGKKRPDGGSGGRGGNVYLVADSNINSLRFQTIHFAAQDGRNGSSKGATGRNGRDLFVRVPVGTIVSDLDKNVDDDDLYYEGETEGEDWEEDETDGKSAEEEEESYEVVRQKKAQRLSRRVRSQVSLDKDKDIALVALGGAAGLGNQVLTGAKHQQQRSVPATKIPGQQGQPRSLLLEMKTIADVGLVGYPNAGKSSLLRALSNAAPKVAAYPFTTLYPTVGVVEYSDCVQVSVADIPGLIEGAHENRGLGHDFLKHIERTKILMFVVDINGAGQEGKDHKQPHETLSDLIRELQLYDEELPQRPMLVFANKYDTKVMKRYEKKLVELVESLEVPFFKGSAITGEGIPQLAHALRIMVSAMNEANSGKKRNSESSISGSSSSSEMSVER